MNSAVTSLAALLAAVIAAVFTAGLTACASTPPIDDVLADAGAVPTGRGPTRGELGEQAAGRLTTSTDGCRPLLDAARAEEADYETLMTASNALMLNADLRLQTALAFQFDPRDLPSPMELIDGENDLSGALKSEIRSLSKSSRELAERALDLRPDDPGARLLSAFGLSLVLWSLSPLQAAAHGGAGTLAKNTASLTADHPGFEAAAPLRLQGRFRSRAPWPYADRKLGVTSLESAVERAPVPLNLLFLGDAYWIVDRKDEAVEMWERATQAETGDGPQDSAPLVRESARLRILSARAAAP